MDIVKNLTTDEKVPKVHLLPMYDTEYGFTTTVVMNALNTCETKEDIIELAKELFKDKRNGFRTMYEVYQFMIMLEEDNQKRIKKFYAKERIRVMRYSLNY